LKRINRQKHQQNVCVGGQSDLESEDEDGRQEASKIETIINQKSKSIADVLLNDGLSNLYGNFFKQNLNQGGLHPFARRP